MKIHLQRHIAVTWPFNCHNTLTATTYQPICYNYVYHPQQCSNPSPLLSSNWSSVWQGHHLTIFVVPKDLWIYGFMDLLIYGLMDLWTPRVWVFPTSSSTIILFWLKQICYKNFWCFISSFFKFLRSKTQTQSIHIQLVNQQMNKQTNERTN